MNKGIEFFKKISRFIEQIDLVKIGIVVIISFLLYYFIKSYITDMFFVVSLWIFYFLFIIILLNELCKDINKFTNRVKMKLKRRTDKSS